MIVMGIDPGTHRCGFSVVESSGSKLRLITAGIFDTREKDKTVLAVERLKRIKEGVVGLIASFKPESLSIERLFINRNVNTAVSVGESRGVVMLSAYECGLNIFEYTPQQIKSAITGNGAAPKEQVQQMVKVLMGLEKPPKPDDVADAIACAICHIQTAPFLKITSLAVKAISH